MTIIEIIPALKNSGKCVLDNVDVFVGTNGIISGFITLEKGFHKNCYEFVHTYVHHKTEYSFAYKMSFEEVNSNDWVLIN